MCTFCICFWLLNESLKSLSEEVKRELNWEKDLVIWKMWIINSSEQIKWFKGGIGKLREQFNKVGAGITNLREWFVTMPTQRFPGRYSSDNKSLFGLPCCPGLGEVLTFVWSVLLYSNGTAALCECTIKTQLTGSDGCWFVLSLALLPQHVTVVMKMAWSVCCVCVGDGETGKRGKEECKDITVQIVSLLYVHSAYVVAVYV